MMSSLITKVASLSLLFLLLLPQEAYSTCILACDNFQQNTTFYDEDDQENYTCGEAAVLLAYYGEDSDECNENLDFLEPICCNTTGTDGGSPDGGSTDGGGNDGNIDDKCSLCDTYDKAATVFTDDTMTDTASCEEMNSLLNYLPKSSTDCKAALPYYQVACGCVEKCSLCDTYDKAATVFTGEKMETCEAINTQLNFLPKSSSNCTDALPYFQAACGCDDKCSLCDNYDKTAMAFTDDTMTSMETCEEINTQLNFLSKSSDECPGYLEVLGPKCGCVEKCSLCDTYNKTAMTYVDTYLTDTVSCEAMNFQLNHLPKNSTDCKESLPLAGAMCGCVDKNAPKCTLCDNYNKSATIFLDDEKKVEVTCEKFMSALGKTAKDSDECMEELPPLEVACGCKEKCTFCSGQVPSNPEATIGPFPLSDIEKQTCLEFGAEVNLYPIDSDICEAQKLTAKACGCPFNYTTTSTSSVIFSQLRFIVAFLGFFAAFW